ncbi:MAG: hypothetical protein JNL11_05530 [Bdellovibrionaceae bacterium]|nr:hypothetical protein [Pseudobdellovibrionaceae bacterium]
MISLRKIAGITFILSACSFKESAATSPSEYINYIRGNNFRCVWVEKIGGKETDTIKTLPIRGCYKPDSTLGGASMPTQNLLCQGTIECTTPQGKVFFPDTSCPGAMAGGKVQCGSDAKSAGNQFKGGLYDCLLDSASGHNSVVYNSSGTVIETKPKMLKAGDTK